ncbi:hypothetical protein ACQUSR_24430 [Streptomyces sp. P1-3]|uniref:hypothetical protein n=1 Tax=Streptomyces sp. P1-3 TaxID=3421658 RepID=UPI003D367415
MAQTVALLRDPVESAKLSRREVERLLFDQDVWKEMTIDDLTRLGFPPGSGDINITTT